MSAARKRRTEGERVEVMLCVLPWLAAKGGAPLAEVAAHFDTDPQRLRADLHKVFLEVEPSVGADTMVDVDIDEDDDDFVTVHLPGSFEEPPRLDHQQALMLLATGTAMAGERGADLALEPALDKLATSLGEGARTALQVQLGSGDPAVREMLHDAVRQRRQVRITYFAWGSDDVSHRTVDPWALRSVKGHWYLTGHCHERGAMRHFRLDRILSSEPVGDPAAFDPPEHVEVPDSEFTAGGRRVSLTIPQGAAWVVDSFPVESWRDRGDRVEVTLGVHNDTWLERLLLRLPPDAVAIDTTTGEDLQGHRCRAARRILERHGVSDAGPDPR